MKACVIAETPGAARALCAGARTMADDVVLVAPGVEAVTGVADKAVHIDVPTDHSLDDAYASVNAVVDAEDPAVVLIEPTRRMKAIAGRLAAHRGTAVIADVIEFDGDLATTMYFGGVGQRKSKATGPMAIYTVGAGVFDEAAATGTDVVEEAPFNAPAHSLRVMETKDLPKSDVDLVAADVVVAGGRTPTGLDAVEWARRGEALGAGEILLTSMDADGTKAGFDLEMTRAVTQAVSIPVIASGGCGSLEHFAQVFAETDCDAALAASLFHFGELTVPQVKEYLRKRKIPVR